MKPLLAILALSLTCIGGAATPRAKGGADRDTSLEIVRLSRSDIGGDIYHCINAGLQGHPELRIVDRDAHWQVKVAVTTRPFLASDTRLVHLTLLRRADAAAAPYRPGSGNARPLVRGYRIENVVIRPISLSGFADTCHSIVHDLVYRHLRP